jgi:RHS repeat-associated protein
LVERYEIYVTDTGSQETHASKYSYSYTTTGSFRRTVSDPRRLIEPTTRAVTAENRTVEEFDSLGRLLSLNDPDLGTWSFSYDGAGNRVSQTDAELQTTTFTYDALGRMTSRSSSDGITSAWKYDEPRTDNPNVVGRLMSTQDTQGRTEFYYYRDGSLAKMERWIDSNPTSRTIEFVRDSRGWLQGVKYPDGEVLGDASSGGDPMKAIRYDENGRLSRIPALYNSDGTVKIAAIVDKVEYTPWGSLRRIENGNGTVTTRTFDANRGWITAVETLLSTGTTPTRLQFHDYGRDAEGIVFSLMSDIPSRRVNCASKSEDWSFSYDTLHRLRSSTDVCSSAGRTFDYDRSANMTNNSQVGTLDYPDPGQPRPHAPYGVDYTTNGYVDYTYDANGNVKAESQGARLLRSYTWDSLNRLSSVAGVSFEYGANGRLLKSSTANSSTEYPFKDYELTGGVATKYFRVNNLLVAKSTGAQLLWLHSDALGSIRTITNKTGDEVQNYLYDPFGLARAGVISGEESSLLFAGARRIDIGESELYFLGSRFYAPKLGRFISPDSVIPEGGNAALNRYAYAFNNPLSYTDPTGHEPIESGEDYTVTWWEDDGTMTTIEAVGVDETAPYQFADWWDIPGNSTHDAAAAGVSLGDYAFKLECNACGFSDDFLPMALGQFVLSPSPTPANYWAGGPLAKFKALAAPGVNIHDYWWGRLALRNNPFWSRAYGLHMGLLRRPFIAHYPPSGMDPIRVQSSILFRVERPAHILGGRIAESFGTALGLAGTVLMGIEAAEMWQFGPYREVVGPFGPIGQINYFGEFTPYDM